MCSACLCADTLVQRVLAKAENRELVTERADRTHQPGHQILRATEWITDAMKRPP